MLYANLHQLVIEALSLFLGLMYSVRKSDLVKYKIYLTEQVNKTLEEQSKKVSLSVVCLALIFWRYMPQSVLQNWLLINLCIIFDTTSNLSNLIVYQHMLLDHAILTFYSF